MNNFQFELCFIVECIVFQMYRENIYLGKMNGARLEEGHDTVARKMCALFDFFLFIF